VKSLKFKGKRKKNNEKFKEYGEKGKKKSDFIFYILLFTLLTLSGCWELKEVDQRSFATAIGIDVGEQGEVILSVHFPMLRRMAPLSTASDDPTSKTFQTITVSGRTLQEAFGILQTETHRWAVILQNKAVIIGETAARKGLEP
jgi:spore germination protein KC